MSAYRDKYGFNPYYNGLFIATEKHWGNTKIGIKGFNPYYNGLFIATLKTAQVSNGFNSFNPYYNGLFIAT
mgnify:CR=1 FL=1